MVPGEIPADNTYHIEVPCGAAHPGVCAHRDGLFYEELVGAGLKLQNLILGDGAVHKCAGLYIFRGFYNDGTVGTKVACLVYRRGSGPRMLVFAECCPADIDGQTFFDVRLPLHFAVPAGLLKHWFAQEVPKHVQRIEMAILETAAVPNSLGRVRLLAEQDGKYVLYPYTKVRQARPKPTEESEQEKAMKSMCEAMRDLPGMDTPADSKPHRQIPCGVQYDVRFQRVKDSDKERPPKSDASSEDLSDSDTSLSEVACDGTDSLAPPAVAQPPLPPVPRVAPSGSSDAVQGVPPKRARRADGDGWARLNAGYAGVHGESYIRLSVNAGGHTDMRGCCGVCGATLNRTCKARSNGQGRPLGLIGAWLILVEPEHTSAQHSGFTPTFAQRVRGRQILGKLPEHRLWFDSERAIDPALDDVASGEPTLIP